MTVKEKEKIIQKCSVIYYTYMLSLYHEIDVIKHDM